MGSELSRRCPVKCLSRDDADSATTSFNRSGADLNFSNHRPGPTGKRNGGTGSSYRSYVSHKDLEPNTSVKNRKRAIDMIPDIALITPCGTLHALLREENENYHEMSVDTPTVPPSDLTLIQYIQAHVQWYNNTALVDGITGKSYKFDEIDQTTRKVASGLAKLGVKRREKIVLLSTNTPEWAVCFLAGIALGAVVCPFDPSASTDEIVERLRELRPSVVIVTSAHLDVVTMVCGRDPRVKIISLCSSKKWISFSDLVQDDGSCLPGNDLDLDPRRDACVVLYSADVTDTSRPVYLTHYNLVMNLVQYRERPELIWQNGVDVVLGVVPFCHPFGLVGVLCSALVRGCTLVTAPHWELRRILKVSQQYKVTILPVLPRWMDTLATHPLTKKSEGELSVDVVVYAAGHFPVARHVQQLSKLGIRSLVSVYGLTEATAVVAVAAAVDTTWVAAGGVLLRDTHCMLTDVPGMKKTSGQKNIGEILVKGPQIVDVEFNINMEGLDAEGWLHTGDVGEILPDGTIKVLGHKEDFLAMSKQRLPPTEMENIVLRHPSVSDVTVTMAPLSASYRAQVVLNRGCADISANQIREFVNGCVSPRNRLEDVELVRVISRSAKGKVIHPNLNLDD